MSLSVKLLLGGQVGPCSGASAMLDANPMWKVGEMEKHVRDHFTELFSAASADTMTASASIKTLKYGVVLHKERTLQDHGVTDNTLLHIVVLKGVGEANRTEKKKVTAAEEEKKVVEDSSNKCCVVS
eukprot:PhM_4_TR2800/c0_g1_i1/m.63467